MKRLTVLLFVTLVMVLLYGQIAYTVAPYKNWDLLTYRRMAEAAPGIPLNNCQPHAYRLFGPYLVGLLPVPDTVGFYAFSILGSIALVFLLYYFLRSLRLPARAAVITVVLYIFNRFWFGSTLWDFFQINDLLSQIWVVVLFLALYKDNWSLFGATLFVGALSRETALLMIPVAVVYLLEDRQLRTRWSYLASAALPALAAFAVIRLVVPANCGMGLIEQFMTHADTLFSPEKLVRLVIYSYLPLSLLPFIFWPTTRRFFRGRLHMLVFLGLVFIMPLFAPGFDERLLAPAFIVIYPLIGSIIEENDFPAPLIAALLIAAFVSTFHHTTARFPLPGRTWTMALSLGALFLASGAALLFRIRARRRFLRPDATGK